ncbi:MAG: (2Fe-2S) ferredoxin domain-containing protein [Elusimicrobia bacterium]|nr:(2Fe-2S) ferredoxin domain-containing protein [Elusimicrobiota bacterium]
MEERKIPYQSIFFVCTNAREGESACSNPSRGKNCGLELVNLLREEVKKKNLKGKIRIAKSGCMDVCAAGPNILVFESSGTQTWYSHVSQTDLPHLIEKHLP